MNYEEVRKDWEYLFYKVGPADDMTGGYQDSDDLERMLKRPTKGEAKDCMHDQIIYWFQTGPDPMKLNAKYSNRGYEAPHKCLERLRLEHEKIDELHEKYM